MRIPRSPPGISPCRVTAESEMGLFDWIHGDDREQAADLPVAAPPTSDDIEAALKRAEQMVLEAQVPTAVLARTLRIITVVRQIVPRLGNLGLQSQEAYTVVATSTDYLPESLASYLALPRDWADTREVANGKSSLLLLIDQLDLLGVTIDRMYDAANRQDAASLAAQGVFLNEKLGGVRTVVRMEESAPAKNNPLDLD